MEHEKDSVRLGNYLIAQMEKCTDKKVGEIMVYVNAEYADNTDLFDSIILRTPPKDWIGHIKNFDKALTPLERATVIDIISNIGYNAIERFDKGDYDRIIGCQFSIEVKVDTPIEIYDMQMHYEYTDTDYCDVNVDEDDHAQLLMAALEHLPENTVKLDTRKLTL